MNIALRVKYCSLRVMNIALRVKYCSLRVMNKALRVKYCSLHVINTSLRVYISPEHANSFTGLDKLYRTAKNHFLSITRKEIRKWEESSHIHNEKRNTKMGRKQSFLFITQTL